MAGGNQLVGEAAFAAGVAVGEETAPFFVGGEKYWLEHAVVMDEASLDALDPLHGAAGL
jgi:hypothetical protein